jgi:hypothetical protein
MDLTKHFKTRADDSHTTPDVIKILLILKHSKIGKVSRGLSH